MSYDKNIEVGSDGAMLYWRSKEALSDDPLVSMLSERVIEGLAKMVHVAGRDENNRVRRYATSPSFYVFLRKDYLPKAPVAFAGEAFLSHVAEVIKFALMPEGWPDDNS